MALPTSVSISTKKGSVPSCWPPLQPWLRLWGLVVNRWKIIQRNGKWGWWPQSGLGLRVWRHRDDWFNHIKLKLYSCYNPEAWNCQSSQGRGWGGDLIRLRSTLCAWKRRWEITGFAFQGVISEVRKWGTPLNWSRKMGREREEDPKKRGYMYIYSWLCCTVEMNTTSKAIICQ